MGGLRYGPGPEVHEEHGPPSRCPLSFSVLDRRPCVSDRDLVHHHRTEFQRRPADGMDLKGFEAHDLDIALFHRISRDGTNLAIIFLCDFGFLSGAWLFVYRRSLSSLLGGPHHRSYILIANIGR